MVAGSVENMKSDGMWVSSDSFLRSMRDKMRWLSHFLWCPKKYLTGEYVLQICIKCHRVKINDPKLRKAFKEGGMPALIKEKSRMNDQGRPRLANISAQRGPSSAENLDQQKTHAKNN